MGVMFLLGAGASKDAGMPLVAELTKELRNRLPGVRDINGNLRSEFADLFDALTEYDCEIRNNYERFFEWLMLLVRGQSGSFRHVVSFRLEQRLISAAPCLASSIKRPILEIMRSRHRSPAYQPGYYARLGAFLPPGRRLKVFTTNFDLCVEDACSIAGINVVTGFGGKGGRWTPSLFRPGTIGINLYKMHGSLNWVLSDDLEDRRLVQRYPPDWNDEPDILLGPGSKLQHDDPFVTLYSQFHQALRRSKVCVTIGYSFSDHHIKAPVSDASRRGLTVIDVNPTIGWGFDRHERIFIPAKKALEGDELLTAVERAMA